MKLTDKQKKKIIEDRANGMTLRKIASKYKVSDTTVRRVLLGNPEVVEMVAEKKRENIASVFKHMDEKKDDVCHIIDKLLCEIQNDDKIKATPLNQIATTLGIVIDKFTLTETKAPSGHTVENNLADAIQSAAEKIEIQTAEAEEEENDEV